MTLQPPEPPLPLEKFAVLTAEIDAGYVTTEVLTREALTEQHWGDAKRHWLEQMAGEAKRNKFELTTRYTTLFKAHRAVAAAKLKSTLPSTAKSADISESIASLDVLAADAPPTSEEAPDTTSSPDTDDQVRQSGGAQAFQEKSEVFCPPPLVEAPPIFRPDVPKPVEAPVIRDLPPQSVGPSTDPVPSTTPMPARLEPGTPWDTHATGAPGGTFAPDPSEPAVVVPAKRSPTMLLEPLEDDDAEEDDVGGTMVAEVFPQGDTLPFRAGPFEAVPSPAHPSATVSEDLATLPVQTPSPLRPPTHRTNLQGTPFRASALPFRESSPDPAVPQSEVQEKAGLQPERKTANAPANLGATTAEALSPFAGRAALPFDPADEQTKTSPSSLPKGRPALSGTMLDVSSSGGAVMPFQSTGQATEARKPASTPVDAGTQLTMEQFASLTAELAEAPDRSTEIRARYKLDLPAHRGEANRWRTHFERVQGSAERFAGLVNQYRAYIRQRSTK